jgi:predicted ATPase
LLSIPTGDSYTALNWTPQRKKEKTFDALLRQLQVLSRQRPVLVIYEDVHWIDPSSRDLLDMTIERVARVMIDGIRPIGRSSRRAATKERSR